MLGLMWYLPVSLFLLRLIFVRRHSSWCGARFLWENVAPRRESLSPSPSEVVRHGAFSGSDAQPRAISFCEEVVYCKAYTSDRVLVHDGASWDMSEGALIKSIGLRENREQNENGSDGGAVILGNGLVIDGRSRAHTFGRWYWKAPNPAQLAKYAMDARSTTSSVNPAKLVRYFSFVQVFQQHFQHVVFDTLPKLPFSCPFLTRKENIDVKILVQSGIQSELILEMCPELNVGRIERLTGQLKAATIYVPQFVPPLPMGVTQRAIFPPLGRSSARGKDDSAATRFLYLPRRKGAARSVANEDEMLQRIRIMCVRQGDCELFVASLKNDWRQDRLVMEDADVIFGPHGGAMSNMAFARPGISIVEFTPLGRLKKANQNARPYYFGLATSLNFTYFNVEPEDLQTASLKTFFDRPMRMNVEKVVASLLEAARATRQTAYMRGPSTESHVSVDRGGYVRETVTDLQKQVPSEDVLSTSLPANHTAPWFVIVSVGDGFFKMFLNWLYYFQRLGYGIAQSANVKLAVMCEDEQMWEKLTPYAEKRFIQQLLMGFGIVRGKAEAAHKYESRAYKKLVSRRADYIMQMLDLHKTSDLIYSDIDTVWLRDPVPFLNFDVTLERRNIDIFAQVDSAAFLGVRPYYCTGFMAFRNNERVRSFLATWSKNLQAQPQLNQPIFNKIRKSHPETVLAPLPRNAFPDGGSFFGPRKANTSGVVIVHNNFIQGYENKIARFKKIGLWHPTGH